MAAPALAAQHRAATALPCSSSVGGAARGGRTAKACYRLHRWQRPLGHKRAGDAVCLCSQPVCHPLAVWHREAQIALLALVRSSMEMVCHDARQSKAVGRQPLRRDIPAAAQHIKIRLLRIRNPRTIGNSVLRINKPNIFDRHAFDTVLGKSPRRWGWGRFHENGRALSRLGRRMHQMGGGGVYGRSARILFGARANLA
jgi:hypothetical protein